MPCSQFSEKVKKHINVIVPLACLSSLIQTKDCQPPEIKKKFNNNCRNSAKKRPQFCQLRDAQ